MRVLSTQAQCLWMRRILKQVQITKNTPIGLFVQKQNIISKDRAEHGKKPLKDDDDSEPPMKNTKQSTTDPECGLFHKGEHKAEFAYTAHTVCDKHHFVLDAGVAAGNVHDSVMFDGLCRNVLAKFPEIEMVGIDIGYKTPWIIKQIFDSGKLPATPYKKPMTKKGFFKSTNIRITKVTIVSSVRITWFSDIQQRTRKVTENTRVILTFAGSAHISRNAR